MKEELKNRTKKFAIDVFTTTQLLDSKFNEHKHQLIQCSSSVGANYRAACRAKSTIDFINKLKIVEEELDESLFFIEIKKDLTPNSKIEWEEIYKEGNILLAIIVKSIITTRKNQKTNLSSVSRNS